MISIIRVTHFWLIHAKPLVPDSQGLKVVKAWRGGQHLEMKKHETNVALSQDLPRQTMVD